VEYYLESEIIVVLMEEIDLGDLAYTDPSDKPIARTQKRKQSSQISTISKEEPPSKKARSSTTATNDSKTKKQTPPKWSEPKKLTSQQEVDFETKVELFNKRKIMKSQHLLKVAPDPPLPEDKLWRKPCFRGNATLFNLHTAIQTCFGWTESMPHRFLTQNGVEIGKVIKGVSLNERKITISQILPTASHSITYQYGNMFNLNITVEQIGQQDSLPSPRLCAGTGPAPPETITTIEEYEKWLKEKNRPQFNIDAVNTQFLGGKTIKLLSGMRKNMDEEENRRFQLSQMCMFPTGILGGNPVK